MNLPKRVKIVEVGPRDGLQNEKQDVDTAVKIALIERLADAGIETIEATAFVSPKWAPQVADAAAVLTGIRRKAKVRYPVLVPNLKGFDAAVEAGAEEIAILTSASEAFSQKSVNCSISESLKRYEPVLSAASALDIPVRGYLSCVVDCPYQGETAPQVVACIAKALRDRGCYEVSLGDTIGVGNPQTIVRMLEAVLGKVSARYLAGHFHDTYGLAIANIVASLPLGITTFDTSVAGLGSCSYATGAGGNVATEDALWLFNGLGIETGVDLDGVLAAGQLILDALQRQPTSRVGKAYEAAGRQAREFYAEAQSKLQDSIPS